MYRKTDRYLKQCKKMAAMRAAKEQLRINGPSQDYPALLPELRRKIIIIDYDCDSKKVCVMDLYKTNRVDLYNAVANGEPWKNGIGWSRVLEWIRKAFPRTLSPRSL